MDFRLDGSSLLKIITVVFKHLKWNFWGLNPFMGKLGIRVVGRKSIYSKFLLHCLSLIGLHFCMVGSVLRQCIILQNGKFSLFNNILSGS